MIEELRVSFFAQQLGTRILSRTSECCRRWSKLPHSGWLSRWRCAYRGYWSGVHA